MPLSFLHFLGWVALIVGFALLLFALGCTMMVGLELGEQWGLSPLARVGAGLLATTPLLFLVRSIAKEYRK